MSWSYAGHRGSGNSKVSGNVLAVTPNQTVPAGAILVSVALADNIATTNGHSQTHILADFPGNPWAKVVEWTNADAAGAGITASVWVTKLRRALTTADPVVFGMRANVAARALGLYEYAVANGNTARFVECVGTQADATTAPTVTLNGMEARPYAFFGVVAREADNANTYTQDADFNDRTKFGTTGGGAATNVSAIVGDRLATVTGETFAPTALSAAADTVTILICLEEVKLRSPAFSFNDCTAVQLRDLLRSMYRTATPTQLVQIAAYIEAQNYTDADLQTIFGVTVAQIPGLRSRIANQSGIHDALKTLAGA
jgi:hypothetical protein